GRGADRRAVPAHVQEGAPDPPRPQHREGAGDAVPHADATEVELGVGVGKPRPVAVQLDDGAPHGLPRLRDLGRGRLTRAPTVEAPGAHQRLDGDVERATRVALDRKSTRLNSSHGSISYAGFCL